MRMEIRILGAAAPKACQRMSQPEAMKRPQVLLHTMLSGTK
jgi:hypothetical protein